MEKEKLLSTLKITLRILLFMITFKDFCTFADNSVLQTSNQNLSFESLHKSTLDASMKHFEKILQDAKADGYFKGKNNILTKQKSDINLLVFVSTSMPKEVLKNYYKEAEIYGATLVFNGLPNGSFQILGDLITELHASVSNMHLKKRKGAAAVIDDEAFKKYKVQRVPTFLLVKEVNCHNQKTCKSSFDKLEGNVGLKYALEQFSEQGNIRIGAKECLR